MMGEGARLNKRGCELPRLKYECLKGPEIQSAGESMRPSRVPCLSYLTTMCNDNVSDRSWLIIN